MVYLISFVIAQGNGTQRARAQSIMENRNILGENSGNETRVLTKTGTISTAFFPGGNWDRPSRRETERTGSVCNRLAIPGQVVS